MAFVDHPDDFGENMRMLGNLLLASLLVTVGVPAPTLDAGVTFTISISAPEATVSAGRPLKIKAEVKNTSAQPIWDMVPESYKIDVRDSNGNAVAETEQQRAFRYQERKVVRHQIPPGETAKRVFDISNMYDMSKPGQYSVRIGRLGSSSGIVESNVITVTVTDSEGSNLSAAIPSTSFSLDIEAEQDIVKAGSEVDVVIETTNNTEKPMVVDNSPTLYALQVTDANGAPVRLTDAGRNLEQHFGKGSGPSIPLQPHQTRATGMIVLSQLYDLKEPGAYTVQVSRVDEQTKETVKSNVITIKIITSSS